MHQADRQRSILDDLKYLPASNPSVQLPPTPTMSTDAPIHPNASSPCNLPEASTSPPSLDQHLLTALPIPSLKRISLSHHLTQRSHHRHPIWRLAVTSCCTRPSFNQLLTFYPYQKIPTMANYRCYQMFVSIIDLNQNKEG